MIGPPRVLVAPPDTDLDRLVAPIVTAFSADPFVRWLLPGSAMYLKHFPPNALAHAATAVANGGARCTADFAASALWFPPGVGAAPGSNEAFVAGIPEARRETAFAVFERMGAGHPEEPCWHLRLLGVDPPLQGRGYGSALLEEALRDLDALHAAAFLESTSPGSRALYQRHGFQVLDEIQAGDSPPLWPMLRRSR
ncbi:MAG TPA: GNAT family N-acetyltransferase [Dehalococcoidia bacterium]|nr:GNAT family N-acetyltransferase [Dehalococcoidia bacterium]